MGGLAPAYPIASADATAAMSKRSPPSQQNALLSLLREIRSDAGLRQVDLAEKLGQPQPYVSRYESGERRLDILELRQVCDAVGIKLEEFVARLEKRLE